MFANIGNRNRWNGIFIVQSMRKRDIKIKKIYSVTSSGSIRWKVISYFILPKQIE